ncbi:MAG: class I SAM-dependent methyltransferase [Geminicoccaceae bacterium]
MSEGFSSDWLSLREPYDRAARSQDLLGRLAAWAAGSPLHVLDLGAGTGSNLRCTAAGLGTDQRWTLVEIDQGLIAAGQRLSAPQGVSVEWRRADLAAELEGLADVQANVITSSALLDLVSRRWLLRLLALRARLGAALYVVLTYDGRIEWSPAEPLDGLVLSLVNRHQGTDKGFGPALGPMAAAALGDLPDVHTATSDWRFGPADRAIQQALLDGYVSAALAMAPEQEGPIRAWAERRAALIAEGASSLTVGHIDALVLP